MYLYTSVTDPDSGYGAFLTPGSGIRLGKKNPEPEFWMSIPDLFLSTIYQVFCLKILKLSYENPDPGSRMLSPWIRRGKNRIRYEHPGSRNTALNITDKTSLSFTKNTSCVNLFSATVQFTNKDPQSHNPEQCCGAENISFSSGPKEPRIRISAPAPHPDSFIRNRNLKFI